MSKQKNQLVIYALIVVNVICYMIELRSSGGLGVSNQALIKMGANYGPLVLGGHQYYRLFTAMFLHLSLIHIVSNMVALICFANIARDIYNDFEFLVIYFLSGITGNIFSLIVHPMTISAGASTAIMGLLGCTLAMFALPKDKYNTSNIVEQAVILLIMNTVGVMGTNVDVAGHLGGFIAGLVLGLIFIAVKRIRKTV